MEGGKAGWAGFRLGNLPCMPGSCSDLLLEDGWSSTGSCLRAVDTAGKEMSVEKSGMQTGRGDPGSSF